MRRLVIGDIHGGYNVMMQVLNRAKFNKDEDMLIAVGDYNDGWPDTVQVIDYLSSLPNFQGILGNHDDWLLEYLTYGIVDKWWLKNGGGTTLKSYDKNSDQEKRDRHRDFLKSLPYFRVIDDKLFVHGGVPVSTEDPIDIHAVAKEVLTWDRDLVYDMGYALRSYRDPEFNIQPYKEVYIGHTSTQLISRDFKPISLQNVWAIDQGAGWNGKLTVIDIDSKEYWQSDFAPTLYPGIEGRG